MSLYSTLEKAKRDYAQGLMSVKDLDTLKARLGFATASEEGLLAPTADYVRVPALLLDEAMKKLQEKGFQARPIYSTFIFSSSKIEPVATYIEFDTEAIAFQIAGGIVAPVAPDGTELVARCDRGSERRADGWQLLRQAHSTLATADQLGVLAKKSSCYLCGKMDDRRYVYLVRKPDGTLDTLGSTCGAKVFGVALSDLWPASTIDSKASEEIDAAFQALKALAEAAALKEFLQKSEETLDGLFRGRGVAGGLEEVRKGFDAIQAREGMANSYITNTAIVLKEHPWKMFNASHTSALIPIPPVFRLNRWGESVLSTLQREKEREHLEAVKLTRKRPEISKGRKVTIRGTVARVYLKGGFERCVFVEDDTGWRYWFRCHDDAVQETHQVFFTGTVGDHAEGVTFMKRVKVSVIG